MGSDYIVPKSSKFKLLWENKKPGNFEFAAQNVELELKRFDAVGIVFDPQPADQSLNSPMIIFPVGTGLSVVTFSGMTNNSSIRRTITAITETYVGFGAGYTANSSGMTQRNNYGVPKKIWGIKF